MHCYVLDVGHTMVVTGRRRKGHVNEQLDEPQGAADEVPKLLKVREVAAALNVSAMTVYRDIEDGKIPATRIRGSWRVPTSYVDDVLADALRRQAEARAGRPHVA